MLLQPDGNNLIQCSKLHRNYLARSIPQFNLQIAADVRSNDLPVTRSGIGKNCPLLARYGNGQFTNLQDTAFMILLKKPVVVYTG